MPDWKYRTNRVSTFFRSFVLPQMAASVVPLRSLLNRMPLPILFSSEKRIPFLFFPRHLSRGYYIFRDYSCLLPEDKISLFPLHSHFILNDTYIQLFTLLWGIFFSITQPYRFFVSKVRRPIAYSPALSKHGGLEPTIIKNNELALFHEGNALESLHLESRKGRKKGGGEKEEKKERERELRG